MTNLDTGHKIVLQVLTSDTVALVKKLLHKACGIDPSLQTIISDNQVLSNDDLTMQEYDIMPNAMLDLAQCCTSRGKETSALYVNSASSSQEPEPAISNAMPQQVPPTLSL